MKFAVICPTVDKPPGYEFPTPLWEVARAVGAMPPFVGGCSPHDRSRGMMLARAMLTDADAFLWVDDDIRATAEQCFDLCTQFANMNKETDGNILTLTGVYLCRHSAAQNQIVLNFNPNPNQEILFGEKGDTHRVTAHGFGFCVVSRKVFDLVSAPECDYEGVPSKAWFLPRVVDRQHLGEDRSFTSRILDLTQPSHTGDPSELDYWPMWVDSRICVEHGGWRVQD